MNINLFSYRRLIFFFLFLIFTFILFALSARFTFAQTPSAGSSSNAAGKYNVTFPIAQLGGCQDYASCRNFCDDPVNSSACISYAKSKGFYKEPEIATKKDEIVKAAKANLGCDSETSCMNFCAVPANHDKCNSFAKSQGIAGGVVAASGQAPIIEKAKQVLGCSSEGSCKSFCEQEANQQKCSEFAKQAGLGGGERKVGPGGCTSEATCKSFCSDPNNYQVCSGFTATAGGNFQGPGGCNSEVSCRAYCQQHESECKSNFGNPLGGSTQVAYNPAESCNRTPNCSWTGNSCQCGFYGETKETAQKSQEYAAYCRANPEKCRADQSAARVDPIAQRAEFESYCSKNPDKCRVTTTAVGGTTTTNDYFDPSTQCTRYGCSWNGSSCQCAGIKEYNSRDSQESACKSGGGTCNWNGDTCNCQGYKYSYPTPYNNTYSYPTPGSTYSYPTPYSGSYNSRESQEAGCKSGGGTCNWNGDTCNCQGYKYSYPTPYSGGPYSYPTPYSGGPYSYPTPYSGGPYSYPTPYSGGPYSYPTPYSGSPYQYPTPQPYNYPTPQAYSYPTPQAYSYPTPQAYSYPTPQAYSYPTPQTYSYPTPGEVHGVSTSRAESLLDIILSWFR